MPFTSFEFIGFTALVLVFYNLVAPRYRLPVLLVASYVFYANASLFHVAILGGLTAVAYLSGGVVSRFRSRLLLALSVALVSLPFVAFKIYAILPGPSSGVSAGRDIIVPLGLSFVSLQAIAYIVDAYRGHVTSERRFGRVALFFALFPKVLAGPIERASDLMPQLQVLGPSVLANVYAGLKWALWGFFCKLVVADNIGSAVDAVLKAPSQESGGTLSLVFVMYAFEIYFDFLGYTNIAIGVARCFNIRLNQNFDRPYLATSLKEFWRRWHISLSSWFRDYLYIPMGGKSTHGFRRACQILCVFAASGLWHGVSVNFLAWGGFHGAALLIEEHVGPRVRWSRALTLPTWVVRSGKQLLTFIVVGIGWVFFRLQDPSSIRLVLSRIAGVDQGIGYFSLNAIFSRPDVKWFVLILGTAFALDSSRRFRAALDCIPQSPQQVAGELVYVNWFVVTLFLLGDLGVRDFTYLAF